MRALKKLYIGCWFCYFAPMDYLINKTIESTTIDFIRFEPCGVISVHGWTDIWPYQNRLSLLLDDQPIACNESFQVFRPDVAKHLHHDNFYLGFCCEFLVHKPLNELPIKVLLDQQLLWSNTVTQAINQPYYYDELLNTEQIKSREDIYYYGPPAATVAGSVEQLSHFIKGKTLDFGCGIGAFIRTLRQHHIEAFGLEINRQAIKDQLLADVKDFISLYDGSFPLEFENNSFDCVTAIEVLEHIPQYQTALQEIHRIAKNTVIITVPDISAIARCYPQTIVPWHLLESTHYHFFTHKSLHSLLSPLFSQLTIMKMGETAIHDSFFNTSLLAICQK